MVTITTGKFVSIEGGRGIDHVVLVEPWEGTEELLGIMEAEPCDLTIVTAKGDWVVKDIHVLSYDIIDNDLIVLTFRNVFWG